MLDATDREDFLKFCSKVDSTVRAWYHKLFEELLSTFRLFEPQTGGAMIERHHLTQQQIESKEFMFLRILFHVMNKSNYKLVSDAEEMVARTGQYLLSVPVHLDNSQIDTELLTRFFRKHPVPNLPGSANQYLLFRRGVGIDQTSDWFILEKIDLLLSKLWDELLVLFWKMTGRIYDTRASADDGGEMSEDDLLSIERIRLENMQISWKNIFSVNTIQEPTFERIILVYRPAAPAASKGGSASGVGERTIHIKHFRDIPMADMEIVLPEKKTPSLTPKDRATFASTVIGGLIALISAMHLRLTWTVVGTVLVALISYIVKVYVAWTSSFKQYHALIQQSMCANLLESEFKEQVKFDGDDAVEKLERLGIVKMPLRRANDIIGLTTDELYGQVDFDLYRDPDEETVDLSSNAALDIEDIAKQLCLNLIMA
eukprot:jgi/Mesen1/5122/ME000255S04096